MVTPSLRQARSRPQTNRAGSTSAVPSGSNNPPWYSGECTRACTSSRESTWTLSPISLRSCASFSIARNCHAATATRNSPVRSQSHTMSYRRIVSSISLRFSRPSRSMTGISSANRCMPLLKPCVNDAEQKPPLRPEAPAPVSYCSITTTLRPGSRSLASRAVQSPV